MTDKLTEDVVEIVDRRLDERLAALDRSLPQAYTVAETAGLLRCSTRTVRRKIAAGEITPIYIGRSIRLPSNEVARLLREA